MLNWFHSFLNAWRKNRGQNQAASDLVTGHAHPSFSQEGEDRVLLSLLDAFRPGRGFYVDVGAHDTERFSNTCVFYQNGWRGVNIEPNPEAIANFEKSRPEDINLSIAISSEPGTRKFFCYNEPALNGIDNDRTEEFKGTPFKLLQVVEIETERLDNVLTRHRERFVQPNFLSIDVEGHEMEVLESNDWTLFPFDFVLVEQRLEDLTRIGQSDLYTFLHAHGYIPVACTGRTVVYKRA
jgi:FkbM family methyltransferase